MALDLTKLPLDDIKALYEVLTGKQKLSVALIPVLTRLIDWGYQNFLLDKPLNPIGAVAGEPVINIEAIGALAKGEVVSDDAKGGPLAGILASVAISALLKAAQKLLNELLNEHNG